MMVVLVGTLTFFPLIVSSTILSVMDVGFPHKEFGEEYRRINFMVRSMLFDGPYPIVF